MSPRSFTAAWLAAAPEATALLSPCTAETRAAAVSAAAGRSVDPAVLSTLTASHPAQQASLDALAAGAVCVVTGQQAGLFGGPLYSVHKAAAAVADARALAAETGHPCVPVFWLQNEDHDFDEIASCAVLARDGHLETLSVEGDAGSDLSPIRARTPGPSLDAAVERLTELLEGLSHTEETLALIRDCWRTDRPLDGAFRRWIEHLFGPHGLLVVDPSHPDLSAAAAPVHRRAIDEAPAIAAALQDRSAALEAAGFGVQVHVRPGAPLSFVHPDGRDGPRHRVVPDGDGGFVTPDGAPLSGERVRGGPHSTSALLRPVLQDTWLPTAMYVGGPGELAYFAQLPPLYAHLGLPMPALAHRARFRVVDETADRLLDQLGLAAAELEADRGDLLARVARAGDRPDPDALRARLTEPVAEALDWLAPHAEALGQGLPGAAEKTGDSFVRNVDKLVERYRKALARDDAITVDRLDRLRARLHPDAPQERVHAWPWYGARYGVGAFAEAVIDAVVPFDGTLQELRP